MHVSDALVFSKKKKISALSNEQFAVQMAGVVLLLFKLQDEEVAARITVCALLSLCYWGLTLLCERISAARRGVELSPCPGRALHLQG